MRKLSILLPLLLAGCASDFIKNIESEAYDAAAESISAYCKDADKRPLVLKRTRIEARREMRQRGENGPDGPAVPVAGLDDKTAYGDGPVVVIWCEGDEVPRIIWEGLIRDWRD